MRTGATVQADAPEPSGPTAPGGRPKFSDQTAGRRGGPPISTAWAPGGPPGLTEPNDHR
jgi:hypothetical protein